MDNYYFFDMTFVNTSALLAVLVSATDVFVF